MTSPQDQIFEVPSSCRGWRDTLWSFEHLKGPASFDGRTYQFIPGDQAADWCGLLGGIAGHLEEFLKKHPCRRLKVTLYKTVELLPSPYSDLFRSVIEGVKRQVPCPERAESITFPADREGWKRCFESIKAIQCKVSLDPKRCVFSSMNSFITRWWYEEDYKKTAEAVEEVATALELYLQTKDIEPSPLATHFDDAITGLSKLESLYKGEPEKRQRIAAAAALFLELKSYFSTEVGILGQRDIDSLIAFVKSSEKPPGVYAIEGRPEKVIIASGSRYLMDLSLQELVEVPSKKRHSYVVINGSPSFTLPGVDWFQWGEKSYIFCERMEPTKWSILDRQIVSSLIHSVLQLHERGAAHGTLRWSTVFLSGSEIRLALTEKLFSGPASEEDKMRDRKALFEMFEERQLPKDWYAALLASPPRAPVAPPPPSPVAAQPVQRIGRGLEERFISFLEENYEKFLQEGKCGLFSRGRFRYLVLPQGLFRLLPDGITVEEVRLKQRFCFFEAKGEVAEAYQMVYPKEWFIQEDLKTYFLVPNRAIALHSHEGFFQELYRFIAFFYPQLLIWNPFRYDLEFRFRRAQKVYWRAIKEGSRKSYLWTIVDAAEGEVIRALAMKKVRGIAHCKFLEPVAGGVRAVWKQYDSSLKERRSVDLSSLVRDLVEGLAYIHSSGYCHGDIRWENIFLNGRGAVLGDFGFAAKGAVAKGPAPVFLPPEYGDDKSSYQNNDVWALGMVLYRLIYGREAPWVKAIDRENSLAAGTALMKEHYIEPSPKTLQHLVWRMLDPNPTTRPKPQELPEALNEITPS